MPSQQIYCSKNLTRETPIEQPRKNDTYNGLKHTRHTQISHNHAHTYIYYEYKIIRKKIWNTEPYTIHRRLQTHNQLEHNTWNTHKTRPKVCCIHQDSKHIHFISSTIDIKHKRQRPAPRTREMDTLSTTYNKAIQLLHLVHGPRTPWMGTLSTNMHSNKGP